MAIKGLTDQRGALPRVGIIRKGAKKTRADRPGEDLTYFRLDTKDASVRTLWNALYPGEPREIEVMLPYNDVEDNLDAWKEKWVAGGLVHRCDGVNVVVQRKKDGSYETFEPGEGPKCPGGCTNVGRLAVLLPQMRRMSTLTVKTTSKHDIKNLMANLRSYFAIRQNLRGIPFILRRVERKISIPMGGGRRVRQIKWLLQLEPAPSWVSAQLSVMESQAVPRLPSSKALALASGDDDDDNGWDEGVFEAADAKEDEAPAIDEAGREVLLTVGGTELEDKWRSMSDEERAAAAEKFSALLYVDETAPAADHEGRPLIPDPPKMKSVPRPTGAVGTNGEWGDRPFDAETMRRYAEHRLSLPAPAIKDVAGQMKACMSTLSTLTNGDAEKQRLIISWLFDKTSRSDLAIGEKAFLLDWGGCKPPEYQPSGFAVTEVGSVIRAARLAAGQTEMELEATAEEGAVGEDKDKLELGDSANLTAEDVEQMEF